MEICTMEFPVGNTESNNLNLVWLIAHLQIFKAQEYQKHVHSCFSNWIDLFIAAVDD